MYGMVWVRNCQLMATRPLVTKWYRIKHTGVNVSTTAANMEPVTSRLVHNRLRDGRCPCKDGEVFAAVIVRSFDR